MGMKPTHSVQSLDKLIVPPDPLYTTSVLPDRITRGPEILLRLNSAVRPGSMEQHNLVKEENGKTKPVEKWAFVQASGREERNPGTL